jgi:hypothetical protein
VLGITQKCPQLNNNTASNKGKTMITASTMAAVAFFTFSIPISIFVVFSLAINSLSR